MDSSDPAPTDHLEFRGEGSEECNQFISAVTKYAYSQGKQRDHEWVADFAVTCFKDDALRWWATLGSPTQGNWKELRRAMAHNYRPSFYGKSGEEAEKFVHTVYERAVEAGRQRDNQWIVDFVSTCLVGSALRWYSSLDSTVQQDWRLLQEAIFTQYPPDTKPTSSIIPTPAAVVNSTPSGSPLRRGRVQIRRREVSDSYYVSRELDNGGNAQRSRSKADALVVVCDTTCGEYLRELIIPDGQVDHYDRLAIRWSSEDFVESRSSGVLCFANSKSGIGSQSPNSNPLSKKAWMIASMPSPQPGEALTIIPTLGEGNLNIYTPDESDCVYFYAPPSRNAVRFFFEPL